MYRPDLSNMKPLLLLKPISYEQKQGVTKKIFLTLEEARKIEDNIFFGTFKSYGGSEKIINGVYSIEDTATIECYFRDDIKSECRIALENDIVYEIINEPEDINLNHQYLKFKVKRVKGGA